MYVTARISYPHSHSLLSLSPVGVMDYVFECVPETLLRTQFDFDGGLQSSVVYQSVGVYDKL